MNRKEMNRNELLKLCTERKIKHRTRMTKQEMIEVLEWNDQDKSINCHPNARTRILNYTKKYREKNPDQKKKGNEYVKRWREKQRKQEDLIKFDV